MKFLDEEQAQWRERGLERELRQHDDSPGRCIRLAGHECINFSSNNYLGLANHPGLRRAAMEALAVGTGATASRLVTGNLSLHERLESGLASFHQAGGARLFNSGYQANLGMISSLAGAGDLLVSDARNHASLIDGCRLSRATVRVAAHAQLGAFEEALASGSFRRRFVVTDSVFSMDGDLAPLEGLRELCDQYDAALLVDEAHAVGVLGPGGQGLCAELEVQADAMSAGLGKAFGGFGGYVVGSKALARHLLNRARSFVFSTALPPAVAGAGLCAVELMASEEGQALRTTLKERIEQLRLGLSAMGALAEGAGLSPIFPIVVGSPEKTLALSEQLLEAGLFCQAIRPPTVEAGTSRLRVAVSAAHLPEDIEALLHALVRFRAPNL